MDIKSMVAGWARAATHKSMRVPIKIFLDMLPPYSYIFGMVLEEDYFCWLRL